jgi:hypothetical protein
MLERGDEIARRTVTLAGTADAMERAFSVELREYEHPEGSYRGRVGTIQVPEEYCRLHPGHLRPRRSPRRHPHYRYTPLRSLWRAHRKHLLQSLRGRRSLRLPHRHQSRRRPDHRHHRAGGGVPSRRPEDLLQGAQDAPRSRRFPSTTARTAPPPRKAPTAK